MSRDPLEGRRSGALWIFVVVVMTAVFASGKFLWDRASDDAALTPEGKRAASDASTRWKVVAEPLQRTAGFQVVDVPAADLKAMPQAETLLTADGKAMLLLDAAEHEALVAFLAARMPEGWDDPFGYGVAWRVGNDVHRLTHERVHAV